MVSTCLSFRHARAGAPTTANARQDTRADAMKGRMRGLRQARYGGFSFPRLVPSVNGQVLLAALCKSRRPVLRNPTPSRKSERPCGRRGARFGPADSFSRLQVDVVRLVPLSDLEGQPGAFRVVVVRRNGDALGRAKGQSGPA